jgi:hypothetical protein
MRVWSLQRSFSVGRLLNGLLVLIMLFPFVPAVIRSSDTQPLFLGVFALSLIAAVASPAVGARIFHVSIPRTATLFLVAILLFTFLIVANTTNTGSTLASRLVSFLQFSAAAIWAYAHKHELTGEVLLRALIVYAVFTVVYFITGGALEDALIHSRLETSSDLFSMGRGARTLSPEPSFFAIQIFNIFVLSRLLRVDETLSRRRAMLFFALTAFCMAASFSAYGVLLLGIVLFAMYPKTFSVLALVALSSFSVFYEYLPNWDSIRAVKVLLVLFESKGQVAELMLLDASFGSRIGSFLSYVQEFRARPLAGEGFALFEGGGFISVIAAFGIVAAGFFAFLVFRIIVSPYRFSTKIALLIWFLMYFISGPIGVPIIGVIVGTFLRERRAEAAPPRSPSLRGRPLAVAT